MSKPKVIITVSGGVAEVFKCPSNIEAVIYDFDNLREEYEIFREEKIGAGEDEDFIMSYDQWLIEVQEVPEELINT